MADHYGAFEQKRFYWPSGNWRDKPTDALFCAERRLLWIEMPPRERVIRRSISPGTKRPDYLLRGNQGAPVRSGRARRYYRLTGIGARSSNESKALPWNRFGAWRSGPWSRRMIGL